MRKFFSDLPFFVEVARHRSFTQAADALDIPLPTISRRIAAMEKGLGIQLFKRNNRKVELTEAGRSFYENCEFVVAEAQNAMERLLREQQSCTGRIRISLPAAVYFTCLQGAFSAFTEKYPGIEMHLNFSSRWVDLYSEPYDLEIRTGRLPDSDLIARKLMSGKTGIYAAPSFLEKYPRPETPQDIEKLPYIHISVFSGHELELRRGEETVTIRPRVKHAGNNLAVAKEFVLAGQGVAPVEMTLASRLEQSGKLVRLLPEWTGPGLDIHVVRANGKISYRVELLSNFLAAHFKTLHLL